MIYIFTINDEINIVTAAPNAVQYITGVVRTIISKHFRLEKKNNNKKKVRKNGILLRRRTFVMNNVQITLNNSRDHFFKS